MPLKGFTSARGDPLQEILQGIGDIPADISIDKAERAFYCLNGPFLGEPARINGDVSQESWNVQRIRDLRNH